MGAQGGARVGAGRKKKMDSKVFKTVGLTAEQWAWMELWFPGGSPTAQVGELVERSRKFWPAGPARFRTAAATGDKIDDSGWTQERLKA